jgi:hypothetical protein
VLSRLSSIPTTLLLLVQSTPDGKRSGCSAPPRELSEERQWAR